MEEMTSLPMGSGQAHLHNLKFLFEENVYL